MHNKNKNKNNKPITCYKCGSKSHITNKSIVQEEEDAKRKQMALEKAKNSKINSGENQSKLGPCP